MEDFYLDHRSRPIFGTKYWQCVVWIVSDENLLDHVEYVRYFLHPTFPSDFTESRDRSTGFRTRLDCWGSFYVKASIFLKSGSRINIDYYLDHKQFYPRKKKPVIKTLSDRNITEKDFLDNVNNGVRLFKQIVVSKTSKQDLSGRELIGINYERTHFKSISFRGVDFSGSLFKDCKFSECNFSSAKSEESQYINCDFSGSVLHPKFFHTCKIENIYADRVRLPTNPSIIIPKDRPFGSKEFESWVDKLKKEVDDVAPKYRNVFISYAHKDQEIALVIDQWLRMQGINTIIDKRDFGFGSDIIDEIAQHIKTSDKIIFIYSSVSKNRPFTKLERRIVQDLEMEEGAKYRSIYLVVDDEELPPEQKSRLAIFAKGRSFNEVANDLLRAISGEKARPIEIDIGQYESGEKTLW